MWPSGRSPSISPIAAPVAVVVLQTPLEVVGDVGGDVPHVQGRWSAANALNAVDDVAKFPFPLETHDPTDCANVKLYFRTEV